MKPGYRPVFEDDHLACISQDKAIRKGAVVQRDVDVLYRRVLIVNPGRMIKVDSRPRIIHIRVTRAGGTNSIYIELFKDSGAVDRRPPDSIPFIPETFDQRPS